MELNRGRWVTVADSARPKGIFVPSSSQRRWSPNNLPKHSRRDGYPDEEDMRAEKMQDEAEECGCLKEGQTEDG